MGTRNAAGNRGDPGAGAGMSDLVKTCWHCGSPFSRDWAHPPTGERFSICAGCYFPFDEGDIERGIKFFGGIASTKSERDLVARLRRTRIKAVA